MIGGLVGEVWVLLPGAQACPLCDSPQGREVRAGIAEDGLAASLGQTLLPLSITIGVASLISGLLPGPQAARREDDAEELEQP